MGISDFGIDGTREFPATSWSALNELKDPNSPEYERNLRGLVERYWRPVYWVIRHSALSKNEDARDLTQEFFAEAVLGGRILRAASRERGSFRSFLRGSIVNFLRTERRDATREKRGGHAFSMSIDETEEGALVDTTSATPEELFDAAWNQVVISEALLLLETRLNAEGKRPVFEMFRRYDLDLERTGTSYADLGAPFGLGVDQVKRALTYARACLRDVMTEIVRGYVDKPEDLAIELRHLLGG